MTSVSPSGFNQAVRQTTLSMANTQHNDEDAQEKLEQIEKLQWIKQNIKMRICSYYIVSTDKKSKEICQCGYSKQQHDSAAFKHPKQDQPKQDLKSHTATIKWNFKQHTKDVETDAFGEIDFVGFIGNYAKFVRVDSDTKMPTMLKLMMDKWGMEKPGLLISVSGGSENFKMKPQLREMFRFGLLNAARNTDAWIITGGTHTSVAKHVGEAIKYSFLTSKNQKDIVAIGIAPWGVIQNRHLLVNQWEDGEPAKYTIDDESIENERFLNPNHSHFILVDNGTQHKFGQDFPFRAQLECNECTDYGFNTVPVILLVIAGGQRTLGTVKDALLNNIPVVIVKGSGGLADLLAYAFKNAELHECIDGHDTGEAINKTKKVLNMSMKDYIGKQMKFIKFCPEKYKKAKIKEIEDCLEMFELIHIFECGNGDQDLEHTMLKALLKANENDLLEQLRLALAWDWIDYARSEILTVDKGWPENSLDDIMLSALQSNKVEFVELLLAHDHVNLETFLTNGRLLDLYNKVSSESTFKALMRNIKAKKKKSNGKIMMMEVGQLINTLLDDCYLQYYNSKTAEKDDDEAQGDDQRDKLQVNNPCLHLFVWSVLNNQKDMAKLFWRKGKDAMAAALIAYALFSAMLRQIHDVKLTIREEIEANSREFMDLATRVLDQCFRANENDAHDLLTGELLEWEKASCILVAMKTNNKEFICAAACQKVFNTIWMGEMKQENGILKLLMCIFIPPLIPLLVEFKGNKDNGPDANDDQVSDIVQEDQVTEGSSRDVNLQKSHPSLQLVVAQGSEDDCGDDAQEETNDNSGDDNRLQKKNKSFEYFKKAREMIPNFYRAPVVSFLSHVISNLVFLCLYSYILISKFNQTLSIEDFILIVWVVYISCEEIRQVKSTNDMYTETKIKAYIRNFWNIADIITIFLFVCGMILKHLPYPETLETARVVLGINLMTFFLRLLQIFSVNEELGPKLVMIIRMVRSLTSFFVMLLIFIVAYAIASHAILYPNTEISFNVLRVIFRRPYWNIYGELMLDEIEGTNDCTNIEELFRNGAQPRCPTESGKYVVPVLMGVYMLMCNILLLNLLIAIFSNIFDKVQEKADMHWRIQRYHHIIEYINRPTWAFPVNLIEYVYRITLCLTKQGDSTPGSNVFLQSFTDEQRERLREWESEIACTIIESEQAESIDNREKAINLRLDQLVSKIDDLQEQQHTGNATIEDARLSPSQNDCLSERESSTIVEPVAVKLDKRMETIEKRLQWIVDTLKEHQPGARQASPEKTDERVEG